MNIFSLIEDSARNRIHVLPINQQEITTECISCVGEFYLREMSLTERGFVCDECFITVIELDNDNEDEEYFYELYVVINGISEKCLPLALKSYEISYKKETEKYENFKKRGEGEIKRIKEYYENEFNKWDLNKEEYDFNVYVLGMKSMHEIMLDFEDKEKMADKARKIIMEAIKKFKERINKYEKINNECSKKEKNEECIICYCANKTIELKCRHRMCRTCVSKIDRCPFCRAKIRFE